MKKVFVSLFLLCIASFSFAQQPTLTSETKPLEVRKPVEITTNEVGAGTPSRQSALSESELQRIELERLTREGARWGLTADDWKRFEELQQGPRKYWSPNLDPLTMLGVEARSENERQRFAELQAKMEAQRAERELNYQIAYSQAFERLFPGLLPINPTLAAASKPGESRIALFVEANCKACDDKAKRLQADNKAFDIYFVGSGKDDEIRTWAKNVGIKPELVQSRQITLNHDKGTLKSVGGAAKLPAVFHRNEGTGLWVLTE